MSRAFPGIHSFFWTNHVEFDAMVRRVLRELSAKYPIKYHVVLAYMPEKRGAFDTADYSDTILPEGIETAPKRFAITYRNRWKIDQSDYVVHDAASGAAQFKKLAERKEKTVMELSYTTCSIQTNS